MNPVGFLGDSLKCLRDFPEDAVYVLHAFQKKTQATSKRDIDTAKARYAQLMGV